ncbi:MULTISPECIES: GH36-type glycosyl hydrolase domain-containing protein [unclassified Paenibacillus]|uniref:GH36-type glycosyl hydrolase domain-containing protein n=1 Tax=unclassified Paenibacillus TaxID=185978 RepID=UPI0004F76847|nr:cellobiose phosphorylase [Paenibacillus sp. FSL H7-0737]AIQ22857.1 cellobiose phosphorylase [Paenibacillus sp. FSL H7-0737]
MDRKKIQGFEFTGKDGEFKLQQPDHSSFLYFPLVNEGGMMSTVTPKLHGQATTGHNTFLTPPLSVEDLHNSRASRNFWVYVDGKGAWSAAGNSAKQNAAFYTPSADDAVLEAGFLWHRVTRSNSEMGVKAEITSFVPSGNDKVELMKVTLTNTGTEELTLTPTAVVPLYARSADDLRDHRHVTSLLNRIYTSAYGVEVQPALSFDERGHRINHTSYGVFGAEGDGSQPDGFFPIQEEFIGEGGSLDWPEAVILNATPEIGKGGGVDREGYEAVGGLRFASITLSSGASHSYVVVMAIDSDRINVEALMSKYGTSEAFDHLLEETKMFWADKVNMVEFHTGDSDADQWMKWVTIQPVLRRLYGNSFLPYHDYGRGGRGWRDLWQDCLALLIMEPAEVRSLLFNNYAGVRIDGSNATIIGQQPGEFIADRNNIPRVWMDHGAWPFLTTMLYLDQSGDLDFLLQEQTYFRDTFMSRCKERDTSWNTSVGSDLRTVSGEIYKGTILEHILLQNLVPFFNVGEHNNILLEGADWNDGLDMGADRGESVAFTSFYASNLLDISRVLRNLKTSKGQETVELAEEMQLLLDTLNESVDYGSVSGKHERLDRYYAAAPNKVSGVRVSLDIDKVADDLEQKAEWLFNHLRSNEWVQSENGDGWFNGYYNNDGEQVEGEFSEGVRMTLTGQVFPLMGHAAAPEQIPHIIAAVDRNLFDDKIGYRLNSRFGGIQQNLGRAFGFAFGHKENGAMFSHMTIMYGNALYKRGYVKEGHKVLESLYSLSTDFEKARIYPGIPEYINEQGRGMYTYLTGSASWLLLTMVTEVFGVKGKLGDLLLEPKLVKEQFDSEGKASIKTIFADREFEVVYKATGSFNYGEYQIHSVTLNGSEVTLQRGSGSAIIPREELLALQTEKLHVIEVTLA